MGQDLDAILNKEPDMGLGNGGLGRLAACFLDSLCTLDLPAVGYGIHYEFGLFRQEFVNGQQIEQPDAWMRDGNPWKIVPPGIQRRGPALRPRRAALRRPRQRRAPRGSTRKTIVGVPWDIPIVGYGIAHGEFPPPLGELARPEDFNLQVFNDGGYVEAMHEKAVGETVSKVLYPNDSTENGKELRLVQQYFFVACSLQRHHPPLQARQQGLGCTSRTRSPSSSTTPTPPSPSPN